MTMAMTIHIQLYVSTYSKMWNHDQGNILINIRFFSISIVSSICEIHYLDNELITASSDNRMKGCRYAKINVIMSSLSRKSILKVFVLFTM